MNVKVVVRVRMNPQHGVSPLKFATTSSLLHVFLSLSALLNVVLAYLVRVVDHHVYHRSYVDSRRVIRAILASPSFIGTGSFKVQLSWVASHKAEEKAPIKYLSSHCLTMKNVTLDPDNSSEATRRSLLNWCQAHALKSTRPMPIGSSTWPIRLACGW